MFHNDIAQKTIALALLLSFNTAWSDSGKLVNATNGHPYKRFDTVKNWADAKAACEELGAHLATITSQYENDWIYKNLMSGGNMWLGGNDVDVESTWKWVTGEKWSYTYWNSGEPNNWYNEDGLEMVSNGKWNDVPITGAIPYLCEWEMYISAFTATPNAGSAPLTVEFIARAASANGPIIQYLWDINGDGNADKITSTPELTHTYNTNGTFRPRVTVVDQVNASVTSNPLKVTVGSKSELYGEIENYEYDHLTDTIHAVVRIYNTGNVNAGSFKVNFIVSDNGRSPTIFKTLSVAGLAARQKTVLDITHTFADSIYGRQVSFVIDSGKNVSELDETNNGAKVLIGPATTN